MQISYGSLPYKNKCLSKVFSSFKNVTNKNLDKVGGRKEKTE